MADSGRANTSMMQDTTNKDSAKRNSRMWGNGRSDKKTIQMPVPPHITLAMTDWNTPLYFVVRDIDLCGGWVS